MADYSPSLGGLDQGDEHLIVSSGFDANYPSEKRFSTIGVAIAYAEANGLASDKPFAAEVRGGTYNESITIPSYMGIFCADNIGVVITHATETVVTISGEYATISNCTIKATGTNRTVDFAGPYGADPVRDTSNVQFCRVVGSGADGNALIASGGGRGLVVSTILEQTAGFAITEVDTHADSRLRLRNCYHVGNSLLKGGELAFDLVTIIGGIIETGTGDLYLENSSSVQTNAADAILWGGTGAIRICGSWIRSLGDVGGPSDLYCIKLTAAPSSFEICNTKTSWLVGAPDHTIWADVQVDVMQRANGLGRGMNYNCRDVSNVIHDCNPGGAGTYSSLLDALDAIWEDGHTIQLHGDVTTSDTLDFPLFTVIIDGLDSFGITKTGGGNITNINDGDQNIRFTRCSMAGELELSGAGATLELAEGAELVGRVNVTGGDGSTLLDIAGGGIEGSSHCIRIAHADPEIVIDRGSYLLSASGHPAILMDAGVTNNNLKIARSRVYHGDGGANQPLDVDAAQTPNFIEFMSAFNVDPDAGPFVNLIAVAADRQSIYNELTDF